MPTDFLTITNVRVRLDVKVISDSGFDSVAVAASGKVVTFNKSFADIRSLSVTAANNGNYPVIAVYDFVDIPNPQNFTVFLLAAQDFAAGGITAGQKVTGAFSWQAEGIERATI
jgi:hypothetical protein